jgi:hypothetical protein
MLHYGRRTHNNRAVFFNGFEGVIRGLIMGSLNIMGSDYGSNISETVTETLFFQMHFLAQLGVFLVICLGFFFKMECRPI